MANPTVAASLNKAAYSPGETATLTVTYGDSDNSTSTVTVTVTDQAGGTGTSTVTLVKQDAVSASVTDSSGRSWTKQSDTGSVAVFTATV